MSEHADILDAVLSDVVVKKAHTGPPPTRGVVRSREFLRVLNLPRRTLDPSKIPDFTEEYIVRPSPCTGCIVCRDGEPRLLPLQNAALYEARTYGGLLGPIPVGEGKTLISLLVGAVMGASRIVIGVPAGVKDQLLKNDMEMYARHFRIPLDRITVVSYSELSTEKGIGLLSRLNPTLIVGDEGHYLKRMQSARTKRFHGFMKTHPECAFVVMSGTLMAKSIKDFAMASELALRAGSPLPKSYSDLQDWSAALDANVREPMKPGVLMEFCREGEDHHQGFHRRLVETGGVVAATTSAQVSASLFLRRWDLKVPTAVTQALAYCDQHWSIDGVEHSEAAHHAFVMRSLSLGFYYKWDWKGPPRMDWAQAHANWNRECRKFLQRRSREGVDTPLLLSRAIKRGEITGDVVQAWNEWEPFSKDKAPDTVPVWIDKFIVEKALTWAKHVKVPSIIWYEHLAFEEALKQTEIPTYGAGENKEVLRACEKDGPRVIALAIGAHSTGKNLQVRFSNSLVLGVPPGGKTWQQLLGRTHRQGQEADEVEYLFPLHGPLRDAMNTAEADALSFQRKFGEKQKLLYGQRVGW